MTTYRPPRAAWSILALALGAVAAVASTVSAPSSAAAAETGSSTIEGFVFLDRDADGFLDPVETGIRTVPVQLKGPVNRTVLSAMNGGYRFDDIPPGTYDVGIATGEGWQLQGQTVYAGLAVAGDTLRDVNFGLRSAERLPAADAAAGIGSTDEDPTSVGAGYGADDAEALGAAAALLGLTTAEAVEPDALRQAIEAAQAGAIDQPMADVLAQALAAISETEETTGSSSGESPSMVGSAPAAGEWDPASVPASMAAGAVRHAGESHADNAVAAGAGGAADDAVGSSRAAPAADAASAPPNWPARSKGGAPMPDHEIPGMPHTGAVPGGGSPLFAAIGLVLLGAAGLFVERSGRRAVS